MITAAQLIEQLQDARTRTLELIQDLTDEQLRGPQLGIVNPLLWEIGHVAWFHERWVLRHLRGEDPIRANGDLLYNSAEVAHDTRWDLRLPSRKQTLAYMNEVLDRIVDRLQSREPNEQEVYFHLLGLFHEDMHDEAFTYTRQTLGYRAPKFHFQHDPALAAPETKESLHGDVDIPATTFMLGATADDPFVFDNEKWAHRVEVPSFRIGRAPVTNRDYAAFVDDGGYRRRPWWSEAGWNWRLQAGAEQPLYWCRQAGNGNRWLRRNFNEFVPLEENLPVVHVNWFEAEAYGNWAGRRLPSEAEWELAASTPSKRRFPWGGAPPTSENANLDGRALGCLEVGAFSNGDSPSGCRQLIGNVWEWTSSNFSPYPGFVVDPYQEYSQPWFGTHKVLRGGCWVTRSRLIRNTWRNFYTPDRRDVWAGFRTCARS